MRELAVIGTALTVLGGTTAVMSIAPAHRRTDGGV